MSDFEAKQAERLTEIKMYKLASILNKEGEIYHPKFEWTVGNDTYKGQGFTLSLHEKENVLAESKDTYRTGLGEMDGLLSDRITDAINSIGIPNREGITDSISIGSGTSVGSTKVLEIRNYGGCDLDGIIKKAEANYGKELHKMLGDEVKDRIAQKNHAEEALKEYAALTSKKGR